MGLIWGREDPGGPHVGPMIFAIWVGIHIFTMHKIDWNSLSAQLIVLNVFREGDYL